jgi:hypothetical protein
MKPISRTMFSVFGEKFHDGARYDGPRAGERRERIDCPLEKSRSAAAGSVVFISDPPVNRKFVPARPLDDVHLLGASIRLTAGMKKDAGTRFLSSRSTTRWRATRDPY